MRFLRKALVDRSGGAAVEFGLIAPILVTLLLGITASAGAIHDYQVMRQAVTSGAQVLMSTDVDMTVVRDLTLSAWSGKAEGSTVEVSRWCRCGTTQHACTSACADGDYPEMYTRIEASAPYVGPLGQSTLTAAQMVRSR